MKKTFRLVSVLSIFILSQSTFAINTGFYVGAGGGYGSLRTPYPVFVNQSSSNRGGLSGRAFAGFNFNKFFGVEVGYAQYGVSRYAASNASINSYIRYDTRAADAVAKAYLPLCARLNLYALAGAASYREQLKYNSAGNTLVSGYAAPPLGSTTVRKTRPIYGAGINYDLTRYVSFNLEQTRIQKLGSFTTNAKAVPYADLSTLNAIFNFG